MGVNGGGWDGKKLQAEFESWERYKAKMVRQGFVVDHPDQFRINLTDADQECAHGVVPGVLGKPIACDCWSDEAIAALKHRSQENPDYSDAA